MTNYKQLIILLCLFFFAIGILRKKSKLIPPLIINLILLFPFLLVLLLKVTYEIIPGEEIGDVGDWIGFLGGYVGAIVAIFGIWYQLQENKRNELEKEKRKKRENIISLFHLFIDACENYSSFMECFIKEEKINKPLCIFPTKNIMEQLIIEADSDFKSILARGYARFFVIDMYSSLNLQGEELKKELNGNYKVFILIVKTLKNILKEVKLSRYDDYDTFKKYVLSELKILDDKSYEIDGINKEKK